MGIQLTNVRDSDVRNYNFRNLMKREIPKMNYLTHNIHPYTAKLIPQIPRYFMKKYAQGNCVIFDPFCGSGTSLLEAVCQKKEAVGIDLNPLAVLISKVKTTPIDSEDLSLSVDLVKNELKKCNYRSKVEFPNKDYWFCRVAQDELSQIKGSLENLRDSFNERIYRFLLVCFSSVIRKSSYADPRIAKVYKSKRVHSKIDSGWVPTPIKYFKASLDRNSKRVKSLSERLESDSISVKIFQADARSSSRILKENGVERINFAITSPPYINAQDYYRSYKLETWWLGLVTPEELRCLSKGMIGSEYLSRMDYRSEPKSKDELVDSVIRRIWKNSEKIAKNKNQPDQSSFKDRERAYKRKAYIVKTFFQNMEVVFKELNNVLDIGGLFCLISGNNTICGVQIPTYRIFINIAIKNGFELIEVGRDEITGRALPPNRNHNCGVIKEEWITVFRKVKN